MEQKNIKVLKCNWGVSELSMSYGNNKDSFTHDIGGTELPHPDFVKALEAFNLELGRAFYATEKGIQRYKPKAFVLDEKDDIVTLEIKGKLENNFDYITNVSSGKLLLEHKVIQAKFATLCKELYLYFFENKTAQLEIDFKKEAANDK